jgi:NAD(P)-dependent dehydrogenase (short-subunit alcohol dehydrogenase family)
VTVTDDQLAADATSTTATGVVVTGAAQGLGKAIARRFADEDYHVVALDLGEHVREVVADLGRGHDAMVGDAGDAQLLQRACESAAELGGGLSAVVLNAGVVGPGETEDYLVEEWDRVVSTNLRAAFLGAKTARRFLTDGGSIVMMSSICATRGFAARASYCASKAGVDGLIRSLAMEWGPAGIRVNGIAPGTIATEMQQEMIKSGRVSEQRYVERIPMDRIGRPEEIADAAFYLCSPRASYITGVVLPVDGGWAMGGLPATT